MVKNNFYLNTLHCYVIMIISRYLLIKLKYNKYKTCRPWTKQITDRIDSKMSLSLQFNSCLSGHKTHLPRSLQSELTKIVFDEISCNIFGIITSAQSVE